MQRTKRRRKGRKKRRKGSRKGTKKRGREEERYSTHILVSSYTHYIDLHIKPLSLIC